MSKQPFVIFTLFLVTMSIANTAAIVYVDADASGPVHNGSSWATAYRSIRQAVDSAPDGAQIWAAAGVYRESVELANYKKLYGGFAGVETSLDQRLIGAFPTVIDPGGRGRGIDVGRGVYTTIDGVTIRNGRADVGAGIRCQTNTTTKIRNCRIENCRATVWGGGLYMGVYTYGDVTNCEIVLNRAPKGGGAVIEYHSYPLIRNCLIARNHATISGGGLYCPFHSGADLGNCTIVYNSAEVDGGGLHGEPGSPVILKHCILAFNSAPVGGGLFGRGTSSALTYSYCNFYENAGGDIGGTIVQMDPGYLNTYVDPLFLMPDRDEYRLRQDSPCAGKGVYALEYPYNLDRVGIAGLLPDGTAARTNRLVVSGIDGDTSYLEAPDRSSAIAVRGLTGRRVGDLLSSVTGVVSTNAEGRRIMTVSASTLHGADIYTPEPLGMTIRDLSRITGLRVNICGRVTGLHPGGFTFSDGTASIPVRWAGSVPIDVHVRATGVRTLASDLLASEVLVLQ